MNYLWLHIKSILASYQGEEPLANFLKKYYKQHNKLGSRDRKILSDMCYAWFRCSKGLPNEMPFEEKLKACLYLSYNGSKYTAVFLPEVFTSSLLASAEDKIEKLKSSGISFDLDKLAPFEIELSEGIKRYDWLKSMLHQPDLFIRARNIKLVTQTLTVNNIGYEVLNNNCIRVNNSTAVDKILPPESYVVQDLSSQATGTYFKPKDGESWWDCCSGAGGKSLLLSDKNNKIQLSVSDRRESILHNLTQRFRQYHLKQPQTQVLDLTDQSKTTTAFGGKEFDQIICDAPCSGSGTWARTPEHLYFFKPSALDTLCNLQKTISANVAGRLKKGGTLFYITCSVFNTENEHVIDNLLRYNDLYLEEQRLINGIDNKADSMFISILKK